MNVFNWKLKKLYRDFSKNEISEENAGLQVIVGDFENIASLTLILRNK